MTVDPWAEIARFAPHFGLHLDDDHSLNDSAGAFVYIVRPAETADLLGQVAEWGRPVTAGEVLGLAVRLNAGG